MLAQGRIRSAAGYNADAVQIPLVPNFHARGLRDRGYEVYVL
jgi:hypothetical protein